VSGQQVSIALLCLGAIAMGATAYLGSPWPGVVLCGLSLVSWTWSEWMRARPVPEDARIASWEREADGLIRSAWKVTDLEKRIEEHGQQINSLRNTVSLRGTLGG
jgi:hypothetical protein